MSSIPVVDNAMHRTYEWLKELGQELHQEDNHHNYQILRVVLHVLRDSLPVNESADLAAQLPLLIRGIYFEGWRPAGVPVKLRSRDEFLHRIQETFPPTNMVVDPERFARAVFALLDKHVTGGELEEVRGNLSSDVRLLWPRRAEMQAAA